MTLTKLYIGNLSSRANHQDLEDLFKRYGEITKIEIKNGYAFVDIEDVPNVEDMLAETTQSYILGQAVRVEVSRSAYSEGRQRTAPGQGRCFSCGEEGHWKQECPRLRGDRDRRDDRDRDRDRDRRDDRDRDRDHHHHHHHASRDDSYRDEYRRSSESNYRGYGGSGGSASGGGITNSGTGAYGDRDRTGSYERTTYDSRSFDTSRAYERREPTRYEDTRDEPLYDDRIRDDYHRQRRDDRGFHPYRRSPPPAIAPPPVRSYSPARYTDDRLRSTYASSARRSPDRLSEVHYHSSARSYATTSPPRSYASTSPPRSYGVTSPRRDYAPAPQRANWGSAVPTTASYSVSPPRYSPRGAGSSAYRSPARY